MKEQPNNPLHGVRLNQILKELVDHYGWEHMGNKIQIRCFTHDPSISSSLKFLRRTSWARNKVEAMYINMVRKNSSINEGDGKSPGNQE